MQPNCLGDPSSCSKIMTQNTLSTKTTKEFIMGQEVQGFGMAKLISRIQPRTASILPAKEETEGRKLPNQTTTERGCGEKHHKRRMLMFGDVIGSEA
ncbi:hypothetical protein EXN66_Car020001 [Channa argus]|uniref:Uncharacterized protein n=1 Tax=Channa argus TaxID=215402 RepID=A0A6G1QNZ9_CHAAH|nr:hypothetical protein EXN66_Car020001 [Channa argus]